MLSELNHEIHEIKTSLTEEMRIKHPAIRDFISTNKNNILKYQEVLSLYRKYADQLTNLLKLIRKEKELAIQIISEISSRPFQFVGKLCFDSMMKNLEVRKLTFVYRYRQEFQVRLSNLKLNLYLNKEEEVSDLINLLNILISESQLNNDNIDQNSKFDGDVLQINEQYFMIPYPNEWIELTFKIEALTSYYDKLNETISKWEKPLWATNFTNFFENSLVGSVKSFDETLCYIPPFDYEVGVSRAVYEGFCDLKPKIDIIVKEFEKKSPSEYIKYVIDEAIKLSDYVYNNFEMGKNNPANNDDDQSKLIANIQSTELLVLFRIIFDRIYEKYPNKLISNQLYDPDNDEQILDKISEISKMSISHFNLPEGSSPNYHESSITISQAFKEDDSYKPAIQFLEMLNFVCNPLDCLYFVHKFLVSINKGALIHRMEGKDPTLNEHQYLLCFDDLFVLMFGVLMATDIPEFPGITNFIRKYSPTFCLTNAFDYAQAGIESLYVHLKSLKMEEFKISHNIQGK